MAGDRPLGLRFLKRVRPFLFGRPFDAAAVARLNELGRLARRRLREAISVAGAALTGCAQKLTEPPQAVKHAPLNKVRIGFVGVGLQGSSHVRNFLRIDNVETAEAAINGDLQLNSVIFACQENAKGNSFGGFADERAFAEAGGSQFAGQEVCLLHVRRIVTAAVLRRNGPRNSVRSASFQG